jgi:hypothetical protein
VGKRGRQCPICRDPLILSKVESLRQSGCSFQEIAALVEGVNKYSISRHFRHSGQPALEVENLTDLEGSDRRLAILSDRLEQQYAAALACSDNKVCLEIAKVQARLEVERHNRIVAKQQAEADDASKDGLSSPAQLDAIVKRVRAAREAAVAAGAIWCPLCSRAPISLAELAGRFPEVQRIYEQSRVNNDCSPTN